MTPDPTDKRFGVAMLGIAGLVAAQHQVYSDRVHVKSLPRGEPVTLRWNDSFKGNPDFSAGTRQQTRYAARQKAKAQAREETRARLSRLR